MATQQELLWGKELVDGPGGESIDVRPVNTVTWTTINARVNRIPVEPTGERLGNQIEVLLSKVDVPAGTVDLGFYRVKLTADKKTAQKAPEYTATELVNDAPGFHEFLCVQ